MNSSDIACFSDFKIQSLLHVRLHSFITVFFFITRCAAAEVLSKSLLAKVIFSITQTHTQINIACGLVSRTGKIFTGGVTYSLKNVESNQ